MGNEITEDEAIDVLGVIKQEGFHYCFINYHDFREIKDPEFHKLREFYIQHANLLEGYLKRRVNEGE